MTIRIKSLSSMKAEIPTTETMTQLIKQPYPITMAQYRMDLYEIKIMTAIIQGLQPLIFESEQLGNGNKLKKKEDLRLGKDDLEVVIKVKDILPPGDRHHSRVRQALQSLTKKSITIPTFKNGRKISVTYTNILMKGKYDFQDEEVVVKIAQELLPEFIALAYGYTQFSIDVALRSSSPYTMRVYQLASHWRHEGVCEISMADFRGMFRIENKYPKPTQIKSRILSPAIKELKKKEADVWPEFIGYRKDGRKIVGWKFKIHKRKGIEKSEKAKAIETASDKKMEVLAGLVEDRKKAEVLWTKCLIALKKEITVDQFETWIAPIKPEGLEKNTLKLGVPNSFFAKKIEEVFLTKIMKNIDEFNVALIHLDRKKEIADREKEKKKRR